MRLRKLNNRGISLIEGMTAAAVMAIGIMGAISGLILSRQQNALANRITTASAEAQNLREAVIRLGSAKISQLRQDTAVCTESPEALRDFLQNRGPPNDFCVIDVDAYDASKPESKDRIRPGYQNRISSLNGEAQVTPMQRYLAIRRVPESFENGNVRRILAIAAFAFNANKNSVEGLVKVKPVAREVVVADTGDLRGVP